MIPVLLALACTRPAVETGDSHAAPVVHPHLLVRAEQKGELLARLDRAPWSVVLARLEARAAETPREPQGDTWDSGAWGHAGEVAQANAMLAWVRDDAAAAAKAEALLDALETDWDTNTVWDVNIRMPASLMGFSNAVDLLLGTPFYDDARAQAHGAKITEINRQFFARYVEDDVFRGLALGPAQNNHPIRTATAIGYVGLAFPEHPDADEWMDWSLSELDYLWGPDGRYVQPDGGVSEGPFYFGFAWGVSAALFIAIDNAGANDRPTRRDCRNRQDVDPWIGHGCVDGEVFTFENPLRGALFAKTAAWSRALRLPSGHRPPLADGYFNPFNGGALLTSWGAGGEAVWDWQENADRPYEMNHGIDLVPHHLAHVRDVAPVEPDFLNCFLPDAGNAVFRSGWDRDARWLLLLAEHGSARKTLHDHVDGTSFSLAAYGEYLLVDPGYFKPNELDNARTAQPWAHNIVLVDGKGPRKKGLLTDWGDADAFLENAVDGERLAWAEARQAYEDVEITRGVAFVDQRYFVVADRLETTRTDTRTHQWRVGGYAGLGAGGTFTLAEHARWEREKAGVDVWLQSTAPGLTLVEPPFVAEQAPHVHQFALNREVNHHAVVDGVVDGVAPGFLAVLAPYRVGDAGADGPLEVAPIAVPEGAVAWEIRGAGFTDRVLMRGPGAPTAFPSLGIESDAAVVIARAGEFTLLARGTFARVDGVEVAVDGQVVLEEGL